MVMPSLGRETMIVDCDWLRRASRSVLHTVKIRSATCAPVMKILLPLMTQESPTSSANVDSDPRMSVPPPDSVRAIAVRSRPSARGQVLPALLS